MDGPEPAWGPDRSCHARARTSQRAPGGWTGSPAARSAQARATRSAAPGSSQPAAHEAGRSYPAQMAGVCQTTFLRLLRGLQHTRRGAAARSWVNTMRTCSPCNPSAPLPQAGRRGCGTHAVHCTGHELEKAARDRMQQTSMGGCKHAYRAVPERCSPRLGCAWVSGMCCNASGLTDGASSSRQDPWGPWAGNACAPLQSAAKAVRLAWR